MEELLARLARGDHAAFKALSERYGRAMHFFAIRMLGDDFLAEDIVQDAFHSLWENKQSLRTVLSVRNYLYGIVRYKCLAALRSREIGQRYRDSLKPDSEDVVSQYIEAETMRLLIEAIETLPPRTGEVIRLSLEGLKQEQIARQMGIALATVKLLKAEGIKKLRHLLPMALLGVLLHTIS